MPTMADITVKNAAGTDVIYNAAMPSAGDKSPARWAQNSASGVQGFRPQLELVSTNNGNGEVRRLEYTFTFPVTYTDTATSLLKLNQTIKIVGAVQNPRGLTTDQWKEAFTQFGNLMVSTLIRGSVETGYAPT